MKVEVSEQESQAARLAFCFEHAAGVKRMPAAGVNFFRLRRAILFSFLVFISMLYFPLKAR